jgi:hypothetical protein
LKPAVFEKRQKKEKKKAKFADADETSQPQREVRSTEQMSSCITILARASSGLEGQVTLIFLNPMFGSTAAMQIAACTAAGETASRTKVFLVSE